MATSSRLTLPTAADWNAEIIEDIELEAIDAGVAIPPTARGSDLDLKATALANALSVLTANLVVLDNDNNVDTAEGTALDEKRAAVGLPVVDASVAHGKVTVSTTTSSLLTIVDGTTFLAPGAVPGKVSGTHYSVANGGEINVVMTKAGAAGNLDAGTKIRFTAPPPGLAAEATVVSKFTGGADTETDAKKRRRIKNRLQNPPKGGNWTHLRELALSSSNAIDNAHVYMALGGPSSAVVALVAPWYNGGTGQSRVASASAIASASAAIAAAVNAQSDLIVVKSAADEPVDLRVLLDVAPGNSSWVDVAPWPASAATVTSVTSNTQFQVTLASASGAPAAGKSIAVWSVADLAFRTAIIQTVTTVSSTIYTLTVSAWQGGGLTLTTGLQVSPAAGNMTAWGERWLAVLGEQTPGEACYAWQEPWSLRKPAESTLEPVGLGARELNAFTEALTEINSAEIETASTTEPTRVTPSTAPRVLCLRSLSFGVL